MKINFTNIIKNSIVVLPNKVKNIKKQQSDICTRSSR